MATRAADTRSRRYDPAETRLRVLEAANHLFSTQGFAKTGTADIARAADVSEGSIFYHFGSKRSLLEELGRTYGERMVEAMRGTDDSLDPGVTIQRCFDYCETQKTWEKIVHANSQDGKKGGMHANPEAEPFYQASRDVVVRWSEDKFRRMADHYGLKLDAEITAALVYSVVGAALDMAFGPDVSDTTRDRVKAETIRFARAACGIDEVFGSG